MKIRKEGKDKQVNFRKAEIMLNVTNPMHIFIVEKRDGRHFRVNKQLLNSSCTRSRL